MSNYLIQGETLANIADAIREKTGSTDQLSPSAMATAIAGIQAGGGDDILMNWIERTITEIVFPDGATGVKEYICYGCNKLSSVELPDSITYIDPYAFYMCSSLETINFPDSITTIGSNAFRDCSKLNLISLPDKITHIGNQAFINCSVLSKKLSLPGGITNIGTQTFAFCKSLEEVTFEGTPTKISTSAFTGCDNLLTINVPWAEGAVANAPWGATNATINYNYTGG